MVYRTKCRCGGRLQLTPEHFGKQVRCPFCHAVATVPPKPEPARSRHRGWRLRRVVYEFAQATGDSVTFSPDGTCGVELSLRSRPHRRRRSPRDLAWANALAGNWYLLGMAIVGGVLGACLARLAF